MTTSNNLSSVIAVNRFGLGAKPNELAEAKQNPRQWLKQQLTPIVLDDGFPNSNALLQTLGEHQQKRRQSKEDPKDKNNPKTIDQLNTARKQFIQQNFRGMATANFVGSIQSGNSLAWRLFDFFSNHFSVSAQNPVVTLISVTLEREAIASNLFNQFEDMLMAATKHPAMLLYLNNERSFGEHSKLGKQGKGLNENLAREILELHTLGVNGGYSQTDVIELAKGITGWSVANPNREDDVGFKFRYAGKEPGKRTLLGKQYHQKGIKQGEAMLKDLARHPKTAEFICYKLVKHFISDVPDQELVASLVKRWQQTNGNIKQVVMALIDNDKAWLPERQKLKTPREYLQSTFRALNVKDIAPKALFFTLNSFAQRPFNAGSPAGFSDEQQDWNGATALMAKIDWVSAQVQYRKANAEMVMNHCLALSKSSHTYNCVMRAESRSQALAMLLLSPEFLRR